MIEDRVMSDLTASGLDYGPNIIHRDQSWNNNSYAKQHSHKPLSTTKSHKKVMFNLEAAERQSPINTPEYN